MKNITILGSTGSIGTQTLDVVRRHPELFTVFALSCKYSVEKIIEQINEFKPKYAVIHDQASYEKAKASVPSFTKLLTNDEGLAYIVEADPVDVVVTSMVGNEGLVPTVKAIEAGKDIALANKETLVTAGRLIMDLAREKNVAITPVDSEHSALFQALQGNKTADIEKILLTASGGPFRGKKKSDLLQVTRREALKHPNWSMGAKISIDSSTLMNKGLEVIEAKWLFNVGMDDIEVVVHPESIIHSMIQYKDSSVMAQMGVPDMRLPILYALTHPDRVQSTLPRLDFKTLSQLTFQEPDRETFPCLDLAYEAGRVGGTLPTVLNAANEVLVGAFLDDHIAYYDIPKYVDMMMQKHTTIQDYDLATILAVDKATRKTTKEMIKWQQQ